MANCRRCGKQLTYKRKSGLCAPCHRSVINAHEAAHLAASQRFGHRRKAGRVPRKKR